MDTGNKIKHSIGMTTADQISSLLARKAQALIEKSRPALTEIIDDGFIYINSQGTKSTKAQYIEQCTTVLTFIRQKIENLNVQDFGSFAIATMILHDEFEYSGQPFKGSFRSFCVFRKNGVEWRWAGGQTSED